MRGETRDARRRSCGQHGLCAVWSLYSREARSLSCPALVEAVAVLDEFDAVAEGICHIGTARS